ncbi:sodium-dependent bicarbonate transport family permease [Kineobactrum sediminis]|uniref:Sodium-dependent bicarbonate transport family permease n=1 Tax=Kineobactrum sediminis TaxID=1905677 RepID=A0A2N5Y6S4_9GAMM|nr:sodium-dependent bicarbonate transport family permease [Kineobactrum sediminis]PLW84098.1 sodium-dependent bicarbonate transport family permease [Kineobactrum sediminis]
MLDPVVLFFLLGVTAGVLKSELRLPVQVYELLSILLLLAIGMKGGIELARQPFFELVPQMLAVIALGFVLPFLVYPILMGPGRMPRADAASIAAHYGSVSVGTFAVVVAYLAARDIAYEAYMPLFVVLLEVPAILVGIAMAKGLRGTTGWKASTHEVLLGKSIVLLVGGLLIGWLVGEEGIKPLEPLFFHPFQGLLALFLLEMGLVTASHLGSLRRYGLFLLAFGVVTPIVFATIGVVLGWLLGLSMGGAVVLATLAASASYIAVPAAMRISVPEANPALSLAASLGVTFPFNVILGIPLYHALSEQFYRYTGAS